MSEFAVNPDHSDGVMLCVRPDNPERFVIEGGTAVEDIHSTILYFGTTENFDGTDMERAMGALSVEIAPYHKPMTGEISSVTTFNVPDGEPAPLVLLLDVPGLAELYAHSLESLRPVLSDDSQPRNNHGFTPHITLIYGPSDDDIAKAQALVGQTVQLDFIEMVYGMTMERLDLGKERTEEEPPEAEEPEPEVEEDPIPESEDEYRVSSVSELPYSRPNATDSDAEEALGMTDISETAVEIPLEERLSKVEAFIAGDSAEEAAVEASTEETFEATDESAVFSGLPVHHTETTDSKEFDGDEVKVRTRSDETADYYGAIYAWHDDNNSPGNKTGYRFPHHIVDLAGNPGPAVNWAVHAALMLIDDSGIPEKDYTSVYNHLAAHLKDAGIDVPELGEDNASADGVRIAVASIAEMGLTFSDEETAEFVAEETVEEPTEAASAPIATLSDVEDDAIVKEIVLRFLNNARGQAAAGAEEFAPNPFPTAKPADEEDEEEDPNEVEPDDDEDDEDDEMPTMGKKSSKYEWEGVLIVEGLPSGDGRMIATDALTWRELPLPLMLQTVNAEGHSGAVIAGSIHEIERQNENIIGRGNFDSGAAGQEAKRLLSEGTMRGVSADIDSVVVDLRDPEGNAVDMEDVLFGDVKATEVLVQGRVMGATLCAFPAFQEAYVRVLDTPAEDEVLVASGATFEGEVWRFTQGMYPMVLVGSQEPVVLNALVASGGEMPEIPVNPPQEWFTLQEMPEPQPFTVYPDGRVYGLIAQFGTCHIGNRGRCVEVPRSPSGYKFFRNKNVLTAEGTLVSTGPIFANTVHPNLRMLAHDAQGHYDHTGTAMADVALYENEWGIVAAGAARPDLTPEQMRAFRGSGVSGDWRKIEGSLEMVGVLAVNVNGFPVMALAASGAEVEVREALVPRAQVNLATDEVESLVAAGSMMECTTCGHANSNDSEILAQIAQTLSDHGAMIAKLNEVVRPIRVAAVENRWIEAKAKGILPSEETTREG